MNKIIDIKSVKKINSSDSKYSFELCTGRTGNFFNSKTSYFVKIIKNQGPSLIKRFARTIGMPLEKMVGIINANWGGFFLRSIDIKPNKEGFEVESLLHEGFGNGHYIRDIGVYNLSGTRINGSINWLSEQEENKLKAKEYSGACSF